MHIQLKQAFDNFLLSNQLVEIFENVRLENDIVASAIITERTNVRCLLFKVNQLEATTEYLKYTNKIYYSSKEVNIRNVAYKYHTYRVFCHSSDGKLFKMEQHGFLVEVGLDELFSLFDKTPFKAKVYDIYKDVLKSIYNFCSGIFDISNENEEQLNTYIILKRLAISQEHPFGLEFKWSRKVNKGELITDSGHVNCEGDFYFNFEISMHTPISIEDELLIREKESKFYEDGKAKYPQLRIVFSAKGEWMEINDKYSRYYNHSLYYLSYDLGSSSIKEPNLKALQKSLEFISNEIVKSNIEIELYDQTKVFRY